MKAAVSIAFALGLAVGCGGSGKDGEQGANTSGEGGKTDSEGGQAKAPPTVRTELEPFRPLLDESARAEVESGGLFIDFGTGDQHKYTRGGWKTGWGPNSIDAGTSLVAAEHRRGKLKIANRVPGAEIVVRARSAAAGQKMTVWVDGKAIATAEVGSEWTVARVAAEVPAGRHDVMLTWAKQGSPRAEVDWMWVAGEVGAEPPVPAPRVLPIRVGERPRRSLIAPTSRAYSFYMQPPADASLVFDYGASEDVEFTVRVEADGGKVEEVFSGASKDAWKEAKVDLAPWAGKPIRLELATSGPPAVAGWGEPEIMVEPPSNVPPKPAPAPPPKNVVLILIDTVRYDVFAPLNPDSKVQTPAYNAWAQRGTLFTNAYDQENWTKPSVATVLSGLYPATHDTKTDAAKLPDEVELLSQRLKNEGFTTGGFIANGYVSGKFGFEKGWDFYRNYIREELNTDADNVYGDALEWIDESKDTKPFFAYIQTIDPHVVYKPPREFSKLYHEADYSGWLGSSISAEEQVAISKKEKKATEDDLAWIKALYWGEVTYHDEHMGLFFEALEERGLLSNTVVIITNDHGEELYDHERLGHGHSLYEHMIRAPLLMHYPGVFPAGKRVDEVVENVDLAPTIIDLLGLEPMKQADGMSLMPLVEGKPVQRPYYAITEFLTGSRAVRVGDYKMMNGAIDGLYNVVIDPGENDDLTGEADIAQRLCEVHMGEGLASPDKKQRMNDIATRRQLEAGEADITPEVRRQLEALGYFGDGNE